MRFDSIGACHWRVARGGRSTKDGKASNCRVSAVALWLLFVLHIFLFLLFEANTRGQRGWSEEICVNHCLSCQFIDWLVPLFFSSLAFRLVCHYSSEYAFIGESIIWTRAYFILISKEPWEDVLRSGVRTRINFQAPNSKDALFRCRLRLIMESSITRDRELILTGVSKNSIMLIHRSLSTYLKVWIIINLIFQFLCFSSLIRVEYRTNRMLFTYKNLNIGWTGNVKFKPRFEILVKGFRNS